MEIKHLSTTLLGGWTLCPRRAWRSYERRNDLGDDNEGTDATRFGTVLHNTLERCHNDVMRGADPEEVVAAGALYFDSEWARNTCTDFEYFQLGADKIGPFLRRSLFDRQGETIATELLFIYDIATRAVWVNPAKVEIWPIINQIIDNGGIPVMSKIDRVDRAFDGSITIFDYKTNILPFTRYEIENSVQLGIYDLVARAIYPEAPSVTCVYDMVRHGRFPVEFDDDFRATLERYLTNLWHQIYAADRPEERLNKYCRWCEIRSDCATYRAALNSPLPSVLTESVDSPDGIAALLAESERLSDLAKIIDERSKEVKGILTTKILASGGDPLPVGDREMYLQPNPRYEYDKKKVFEIMQSAQATVLIPSMVSLSKQAVEKTLKSRPDLLEAVNATQQKKFINPSLKTRALKGGKLNKTEGEENDE